jgi:hypothetical protein
MHNTAGRRAGRGARACRSLCACRRQPRPRVTAANGAGATCIRATQSFAGVTPASETSMVPTPRPAATTADTPNQHPTEQAGGLTRAVGAR